MKLPQLSARESVQGKRILLRVDWNIPRSARFSEDVLVKIERSIPLIRNLVQRGAIIVLLTHWGEPKKCDAAFSTQRLAKAAQALSGISITFLDEDLENSKASERVREKIIAAKPGAVFLLENLRFSKGEEKNDVKFAKQLALLGDLYINDAFAVCHRRHASVVALPRLLPAYAGPNFAAEVSALQPLFKAKRPFVAFVGGAKLSTKLELIKSLVRIADFVCIGGAMAHAFWAAQKKEIGGSFVEKEGIALAKKLINSPKIRLPLDCVIASKIAEGVRPRVVVIDAVKKRDVIGDIGTETMCEWSAFVRGAKTIVWNGPMGCAEFPAFSHGSLVLARAIAARSKGRAYGVVGGGDTLPVVMRSGMSEWIDHLSTGGGAMLDFLAINGKLPGLVALERKAAKNVSKKKK